MGLAWTDPLEETRRDHVVDRVERHVRVHRSGSESDEQGHVVNFSGIAALYDQPDLCSLLLADQVLVHCGREQKRWDRGELHRGVAVGQNDDVGALTNRCRDLAADRRDGRRQECSRILAGTWHREQSVDGE